MNLMFYDFVRQEPGFEAIPEETAQEVNKYKTATHFFNARREEFLNSRHGSRRQVSRGGQRLPRGGVVSTDRKIEQNGVIDEVVSEDESGAVSR